MAIPEKISNYFNEFSDKRKAMGLRWWKEILFIIVFYLIYSYIRNRFGSNSVSPMVALNNAKQIIRFEEFLGLFKEMQIQDWFIDYRVFIQFWNVFYGLFHFAVTILVFVWLYFRFPKDFPKQRTVGLITTGLGLVGFAVYPVMPPRLLGAGGELGSDLVSYGFVDTVKDFGGLWSFDSGVVASISNQYAAMPSIHIAWALWCGYIVYSRVKSPLIKAIAALYPLATLFAITVTANHYWLDAVGGLAVLLIGYYLSGWLYTYFKRFKRVKLSDFASVI